MRVHGLMADYVLDLFRRVDQSLGDRIEEAVNKIIKA